MSKELSLVVTPQRTIFPALPTPQQAYVLIEVLPLVVALDVQAPPINLCLVLDRSGSMAGTKLGAMKEAANLVIDRLGPQDMLAVVIFDDASPAELVIPSGPVLDQEGAKRKIDAIEERGGTHMATGMRLGLEELRRSHQPQRVSAMLLLTDGQTWEDTEDCRALAQQCQTAGIPIHVLGLGVGEESNWDPKLLEDLAQLSGGEWMPVEAPDQVSAAFENTLFAMKGAVATHAQLTMRFVKGLTTRAVWRVTPLISRLDHHSGAVNDIQVFLGDIHHRKGQAILVDLVLPPRLAGAYRLIQADVTYDVPGSGLTGQKTTADPVLNFVEDTAQVGQLDERLMNLIERVIAHKLQTQALDEAAAGDAAKATQRLRAAATRLLELGEVEMAQQTRQQAERLEQSGQLDLAASQKMRYATKRLTETDIPADKL
jgi:Ca-activated chloride channel family protein